MGKNGVGQQSADFYPHFYPHQYLDGSVACCSLKDKKPFINKAFRRDTSRYWSLLEFFGVRLGGEGGIRTHGGLAPTPDFESGTFDHSATSPIRFYAAWLFSKSAIVAEQAIYGFILRLKCFDSTHVWP